MKAKLLLLLVLLNFTTGSAQFGPQQIISTTTEKPYLSIPVDIDNDGFVDVLSASAEDYKLGWYKNTDGTGNFGPKTIINETTVSYLSVDFVDLNSDGDKDILYHSNNPSYIAWLENLDGAGTFGPEQIILEQDFVHSVIPADIDQDGDLDVITALTDTSTGWISWFENLDGQGAFGNEIFLFDNDNEFWKIMLEDIDNDGLLDIMATDFVLAQGKIFWYKNLGNATYGSMQVIYQFVYAQSGGTNIYDFSYVDINTDGRKDLVISSIDDESYVNTNWLENLDDQGNFGPLQFIHNILDLFIFYDLDIDGDMDMLMWNNNTDTITWKENEDGLGTFSDPNIITTQVDFPRDAKVADIDGDGWPDVVSASTGDDKIAWYQNTFLGIAENESNHFIIFPNPTDGLIRIRSNEPVVDIGVSNILGQTFEVNWNMNEIDFSHLKTGIYFLKIKTQNGYSETHKIIKN